MASREAAKCGTDSGYQSHRRKGEGACAACLAAHAEAARTVRRAAGVQPAASPQPHGTRAAYERERRAYAAGTGQRPCDACTAAKIAYQQVWRSR